MTKPSDREILLGEVLLDPADDAAILSQVLGWAGDRRRRRRRLRAAGISAGVAALALVIVAGLSPRSRSTPRVRTNWTCPVVATVRFKPDLAEVHFEPVARVETSSVGVGYRSIGDRELLVLAADRGGVLVRTGPGSERLVFPQ